ncbi:MAG TPA: hypothetical protein DDW78_05720 [Treponema sp.]|nr:hypothetical protein [Treponema sp.]
MTAAVARNSGSGSFSCPAACFLLLSVCGALVFSSCDTAPPAVASVDSRVIFDYADSVSAPSVRLAVFLQVRKGTSLNRKSEQGILSVSAPDERYVWDCPAVQDAGVSDGGRWVGSAHFLPPPGTALPVGVYRLRYSDASGRRCEESFSVSYPAELAAHDVSAVQGIAERRRKMLSALYRQDGTLLFLGDAADGSQLPEDAGVMRRCVLIDGGSVVCMLPPEDA